MAACIDVAVYRVQRPFVSAIVCLHPLLHRSSNNVMQKQLYFADVGFIASPFDIEKCFVWRPEAHNNSHYTFTARKQKTKNGKKAQQIGERLSGSEKRQMNGTQFSATK